MKWCFLLNQVDYLIEFLNKLSLETLNQGDECIVIANSKISEFTKKRFFTDKRKKIISKVDWLEKNYKKGPNKYLENLSWKEFFPTYDRKSTTKSFTFNYDNSIEIVSQLYQFIDFVFKTEKPKYIVSSLPSNIFSEIIYYFCEKNNISYLGFIGSRIKGQIDIFDLKYTCSRYKKSFEKIRYNDLSNKEHEFAKNFVLDFITHKKIPSYEKKPSAYKPITSLKRYIKREKEILKYILKYYSIRKCVKQFDYESEAVFKHHLIYIWYAIKRYFRILTFKNIFDKVNDKDKFFLFPLHIQPEASTSVLATYFSDQINSAKNAAFSLPFGYKLYVREHPSSIGYNTKSFYKKLKQIPNIVLISTKENMEDLIKKSQGVVTLTSTVGMETALIGKHSYILGNVFYTYHPLCQKINSFEELKEKIREQINNKNKISKEELEKINSRFIISYFNNTVVGDINAAHIENDTNNYNTIYNFCKTFTK